MDFLKCNFNYKTIMIIPNQYSRLFLNIIFRIPIENFVIKCGLYKESSEMLISDDVNSHVLTKC